MMACRARDWRCARRRNGAAAWRRIGNTGVARRPGSRVCWGVGKAWLRGAGLPWHTQRDRVADMASAFGLSVRSIGEGRARSDVARATEVGEAFESPRKGAADHRQCRTSRILRARRLPRGARAGLVATCWPRCRRSTSGGLAAGRPMGDAAGAGRAHRRRRGSHRRRVIVADRRPDAHAAESRDTGRRERFSEALAAGAGSDRMGRAAGDGCGRAGESSGDLRESQIARLMPPRPIRSVTASHFSVEEIRRLLDPEQYLGAAAVFQLIASLDRWHA